MNESLVGEACSLESLVGRLADEFLRRQEAGERPDVEDYVARYPQAADLLRKVLASLRLLEASLTGAASPGEPGALATGDEPTGTLGDFRLIREVGRGGMGIVYEAEQISLGRRVALKVLPFAATMDPRHLQRFQNEARAAASLHHTNIVPVHAVGCERAVHFYAMQFIEGQTLAAMIAELRQRGGQAPLPEVQPTTPHVPGAPAPATPAPDTAERAAASTERPTRDPAYFRRVADLGIQAAEALDHAHQLGIVHRDVKPANLMVDGRGNLWVTDFGLAQVQSDARVTMTGDLVGTLRYMSPEQALAKRVVIDHRTDVYSLGATLYELLTLQPAFDGADRQELLRQIAFEDPKPLRRINRAIPAELETIVLKAMEKNPQERYATARELADDLERFVKDEPIRAKRPGLFARGRKWARRHRAAVGAAAVCLVVSLVAAVGSGAWGLSERATRQQEAEGKVLAALEEAEPGLRAGNPRDPALITAVQRAEAQLSGGALKAEPRQRVEQLRRDQQMLTQLEDARLQAAAPGKETGFDLAGADQLYAEAFARYGVDVNTLDPQEAAELLRASAIRSHLVVALDHWAIDRELWLQTSGAPLRAVADRADDDPWRRQVRAAAGRRDWAALESLAKEEEEAHSLPTGNLVLLAHALSRAASWEAAQRLLTRAQLELPADFWSTSTWQSPLSSRSRRSWRRRSDSFRRRWLCGHRV